MNSLKILSSRLWWQINQFAAQYSFMKGPIHFRQSQKFKDSKFCRSSTIYLSLGNTVVTSNIFIFARIYLNSSIAFGKCCLIFQFMTFSFMSITIRLILIISLTPPTLFRHFQSWLAKFFNITCIEMVLNYSANYDVLPKHVCL